MAGYGWGKFKYPELRELQNSNSTFPQGATKHGEIYLATNRYNGKRYVGQATEARYANSRPGAATYTYSRWLRHAAQARRAKRTNDPKWLDHFHRALIKWGDPLRGYLDAFELKILDVAHSHDELQELEQKWVIHFDTLNPAKGYNIRGGGKQAEMREGTREKRIENRRLERERLELEHGFPMIHGRNKLKQMGADRKLIRLSEWWGNSKDKGWLCLEWTEKLVGFSRFYHEVGRHIELDFFRITPKDPSKPMDKDNVRIQEFETAGEVKSAYLSEYWAERGRKKSEI